VSKILDGKKMAAEIREGLKREVGELAKKGTTPTLALVTASDDEAALAYVRSIIKAADAVGIKTKNVELSPGATFLEISEALKDLAKDKSVHGIILQTPLPAGIDADELRVLIPATKDIDGASPLSAGRLVSGLSTFAPATAVAVMEMLKEYKITLQGIRAVMLGRSRVVGKPLAHLLLDANATVTICHSKTKDLAGVASEADVLIVAIGKPNFINSKFVKGGAVVIDVGTNITSDGKMVGDVDSETVSAKAGALSPVPGGVGPVTTAILLKHTVIAASL
jgi:methylenetetrahydrofolate dehydrogenase (NADP+)/methenyltetrahydrofolate cyclohydrolase